jgi:hypothetical protein
MENVMKKMHLALVYLAAALLAAGCGGGGGTTTTTIPTAAVQITPTNAPVVAKSANTSSQGMAKSGSSMAGVVGVVAQSSVPTRSVLDISLAKFAQVRGMQLAPATGVVGVIAGYPMTINCATAGSMTLDIQDGGIIGTIGAGDVLTMSFTNCNDGISTDSGSLAFTIGNLSGAMGGTGSPSVPLTASFTLTFNQFSTRDNATGATDSINGDITLSTSDNGTNTTGTMSGSSLSMSSSVDGAFQMTSYSISFTEANVPTSSTPYSFSFNMTTASVVANGSITITTTTPFTGMGAGDPTAGVMVITGASGSTLTLTANADGIHVGMVVDDDGAAGPHAPVAVYADPATSTDYTWATL